MGRLQDLLTLPAQGITDPVERGTARLLSSCLLGMLVVFSALDFYLSSVRSGYEPPWYGYGLLTVAYALSRTRNFKWGAVLATLMFPSVAFAQVLLKPDQTADALSYALLAPFVAGLFLGTRGAIAFSILNPLWILALPLFYLPSVLSPELINNVTASVIAGLVAVSYAYHRKWAEERRQESTRLHEAQLIQMQKMEALGRMAGGIAHDFNNLLTVISGGVELLAREGAGKEIKLIDSATNSAQKLTSQLLTLSRQGVVERAATDLRTALPGMEQLLRRIIGEDIELLVRCKEDTASVVLAESQLEQILLNLATNARDAMPRGGRLTFSARNADSGYVELSVSDTGTGMDAETAHKAFEPFFTTKSVGKGTGLGLSTVFGLVTGVGGRVSVDSAPGRGTTFRLLLPLARDSVPAVPMSDRRLVLGGKANGRILLVEDDVNVRELCRSVLRREGYEVIEAAHPEEALELALEEVRGFDLLVTDVIMPGMSGVELSELLRAKDPELPVLFMSGYAPDEVLDRPLDGRNLLKKPFRPTELLRRVSAILFGLDSQAPPTSPEARSGTALIEIPPSAPLPSEVPVSGLIQKSQIETPDDAEPPSPGAPGKSTSRG